jgi:hypothetical protein
MELWNRLQAALVRLGIAGLIIAFIAGIVVAAYFAALFPDWTGFAADPIPPNTALTPIVVYQGAKTLWDWLQLLLLPLVITAGGYVLTRSQNRYALQLEERRETEARAIEEQRILEARTVEEERAQDAALQAYLDLVTQLLLHEKLQLSSAGDEVRGVARARTLTVLGVLSGTRQATVVQFLYEANLIGSAKREDGTLKKIDAVVSLEGANLEGVQLEGARLIGACLTGARLVAAHLRRADLRGVDLSRADLRRADLSRADLRVANLRRADLTNCNVTREQLAQARSLHGAKLPI